MGSGGGGGGGHKKRPKRKEAEPLSASDDENVMGGEQLSPANATRSAAGGKRSSLGGTFPAMGLSPPLLKAIQRKGYRLPTPIQRKCIPPLLAGRDVVGMARTGSGKTAAFLLPLLYHLREHSLKVGIRGLILSPSRELALQTATMLRELSRFTNLRTVALVGGENLEEQFAQLATNPDILVATPGRLMHVCVETRLSLRQVQFVVWDEADRLMEDALMAGQMREIVERLPETRQTALFSATLPQALAEFAQAGLRNPLLVRLDVESKLSPDLSLTCLHIKSEQKDAALLLLLGRITALSRGGVGRRKPAKDTSASAVGAGRESQLTVIFVATKHHVEYLQELLGSTYNLPCTYIYGALDQTARKQALELFRRGTKPILIVTDVAARGIDVPLLDNVINYDFPSSPKLFVHRVGRVARAGRPGRAFSLVCPDELPYLLDLQLFLGKELVSAAAAAAGNSGGATAAWEAPSNATTLCFGDIPQWLLDDEEDTLQRRREQSGTLHSLLGVMNNATRLYRRTRPTASPESHRRAKEFTERYPLLGAHPFFGPTLEQPSAGRGTTATTMALETSVLVQAIHQFKPKRASHLSLAVPVSALVTKSKQLRLQTRTQAPTQALIGSKTGPSEESPESAPRQGDSVRDHAHYLSYTKADAQSESGYALVRGGGGGASFAEQARQAIFDLGATRSMANDDVSVKGKRGRRRGPTNEHPTLGGGEARKGDEQQRRNKLIRTEVGTQVPASFRTDLYDRWRARTHLDIQRPGEQESEVASGRARAILQSSDERRKWRGKQLASSARKGRRKVEGRNRGT